MKRLFFKIPLLIACIASFTVLQSCDGGTKTNIINRPIGSEIDVFWNLVENGRKNGKNNANSYLQEFLITNNSAKT